MMKNRAAILALAASFCVPLWSQSATLAKASFSPGESMETILGLSDRGRVSLRVTSSTGVAMSLHDRMEGQLARDGAAGSRDGRIDLSLDRGDYKVKIEGSDSAGKPIALQASLFREVNGDKPASWPRLPDAATITTTLKDLESASYWIELRKAGPLEFEAMGRDLASVELWREGQYLLLEAKVREERSLESGRPMGWTSISKELPAGLYLVKVHGGQSRSWPKEDARRPLHVRSGFARMPVGGRLDLTVSPFGRDFFLVRGYEGVSLSRKDKAVATLACAAYSPGRDRLSVSDRSSIDKNSAGLSCALGLRGEGSFLVTVAGNPGDRLYLDGAGSGGERVIGQKDLAQGGLLTVSAPRSAAPELEPSGFVYRLVGTGSSRRLVMAGDFSLPLSGSQALRRRLNTGSGSLSLYLRVEEAGSYRLAEKTGTGQSSALYRVDALEPTTMRGRGSSRQASADKSYLELAKGWYRLDIEPQSIGVLDFILYKDGFLKPVQAELAKDPPPARLSQSWVLPAQAEAAELHVVVAGGSPRGAGLAFRPFPLDLAEGLALELGPQEELSLPAASEAPGRFRWIARGAGLSLDGQQPLDGQALAAGRRTILLRNPGTSAQAAAFAVESNYDDLSPPAVSGFGKGLASLQPGTTAWRDFGRRESATWAFEVSESAVYVVESVGRLSTSLTLRTASRLKVFGVSANGYGRNASLRAWLRPGQYYVEVSTEGQSSGRAGLRVDRVPLGVQAVLDAGAVDRRALPADSAMRLSFGLDRDSAVALNSVGLSAVYPVRLEDTDGFIAYAGQGRTRLQLPKGRYLLYGLPLSLETNRLTWIELLDRPEPPAPVAGTRLLAPNSRLSATWRDGPSADRYSFSLSADLEARLSWPAAFEASLEGPGGPYKLDASGSASMTLKRGTFVLALRPRDRNNLLSYEVGLSVAGLAPGLSVLATVDRKGMTIPVTVPEDGFYELWSLGRNDLSARLVDPATPGLPLAASDDNGPDWNFDLVQRLKAGRYELRLESLAGSETQVRLTMVSRNARVLDRVQLPFEGTLALDEAGLVLPFDTKADEGLFQVTSSGGLPVSLRLYKGDSLLASGEGSLALPLRKGTGYSLYAWSPLGGSSAISVRRLPERTASLSKPQSLEAGAVLRLQNPDGLSARSSSTGLLVSPGPELPCVPAGTAPFSVLPEGGWAWSASGAAAIEPLTLGPGTGAVLSLSTVDQGFVAASADKALLVSADSRGQFRCGISARPDSVAGPAPYSWDASAAWSQGSVALLPPGSWKARVWDGQRAPGILRRTGVGLEQLELALKQAPAMGKQDTYAIPPGGAIALDLPATTLSALLGEGIVLSAWKDGQALATRSGLDGRRAEVLSLPACRLFLANPGAAESSARLALLPARSLSEDELSATRPFEAVNLPAEGTRLQLKVQPGELLCLAGESVLAELESADGSYASVSRVAADGLFTSLPASSGAVRLSSKGGLVRAWIAKPGAELAGLVAQEPVPVKELKDAAVLSGRGDAFRFTMAQAGYVDISCPGPALLSLTGGGQAQRTALSGSRDDLHLFAWLGAGEYFLWQRPAKGSSGGGILRLDRVESQKADPANPAQSAFIGAREYQAWSFTVTADALVGVGVKAEDDGLQGYLYDARQGLVAKGALMFAELAAGDYLLVVKGLDRAPMEYGLVLAGTDGSRLGVPQDVVDSYKAERGKASSVSVPMRWRSPYVLSGQPLGGAPVDDGRYDGGDGGPGGGDEYYGEDGYGDGYGDGEYYGEDGEEGSINYDK